MPDTPVEKLRRLLKDMFQFDCAELDFGIYRIMNFKRETIERFIEQELVETIGRELSSGILASDARAAEELKELAEQIRESLSEAALNGDGVLSEQFHDTKVGRRYLELQSRASGAQSKPVLEAAIFNHLYAFFSRYYDAGDFLSKRRYSRKEKYAVPYNGEEIYLHWANNDQYYIKTGEYFKDYSFKALSITVHFRLREADVPQNNVEGGNRFFVPSPKDTSFDAKASEIVIPFELRSLTKTEQTKYGQRSQQDAIIAETLKAIQARLKKHSEALTALLAVHHKTADGEEVTLLAHHMRQYTRKNTSDFFIHRDLKGFLTRELDFYLKNEVLNLDEVEAAGETRAEGWFQLMRVIGAIGGGIIEFLAQIEDFQKMLFEKRKFITDTQYWITVGNIDVDFYAELATNDIQWAEWKELFHIDEEQVDLFTSGKSRKERRIEFLKNHPTLVLDTRHFASDLVDRLLSSFGDLDQMTDGLLIQSENFQALNLLVEKYREKVNCIYIDPPYNTGNDGFLYKDIYQHSSWITMMHNRLVVASSLLSPEGFLFSSIDENEVENLLRVLALALPQKVGIVVVQTNPKGRGQDKYLAVSHDYLVGAAKSHRARLLGIAKTEEQLAQYSDGEDENGPYRLIELRNTHRQFHKGNRPNLWYPFYVGPTTGNVSLRSRRGLIEVYPLWPDGFEGCWTWGRDLAAEKLAFLVGRQVGDRWTVFRKDHARKNGQVATFTPKTIWDDREFRTDYGQQVLDDVLGERAFASPKPPALIAQVTQLSAEEDGLVLDFFAGSGTTAHSVIQLGRDEGKRRRFILVEMGQHFENILLPRIKKLTFSPEWRDGKPVRQATAKEAECSPRIVKLIRLESYEGALNNIEFDDKAGQAALRFDDYMLKYMLKWEAKQSATLLNVEKLTSPFTYKLRITEGQETRDKVVDLPETFAYLLGLHVSTRRVFRDKDRRYLVYRGRIDHREFVVIWRNSAEWGKVDFERDKQFVNEQNLTEGADEILVNGDSVIPGARSLDGVFKARMFAPVGV